MSKLNFWEYFGVKKGLQYEEVRGLTSSAQIDALLLGFSREDIMKVEFGVFHVLACLKGISIEQLRYCTEKQAQQIYKEKCDPGETEMDTMQLLDPGGNRIAILKK